MPVYAELRSEYAICCTNQNIYYVFIYLTASSYPSKFSPTFEVVSRCRNPQLEESEKLVKLKNPLLYGPCDFINILYFYKIVSFSIISKCEVQHFICQRENENTFVLGGCTIE